MTDPARAALLVCCWCAAAVLLLLLPCVLISSAGDNSGLNLTLTNNYLTGPLPGGLDCLLGQLDTLDLAVNQLTGGLPANISRTNISQLVLSNNLFSGTVPSELSSMRSLQVLLLQQNSLTGNPAAAFNGEYQQLLTAIELSFNDFTGEIPSTVFSLPQLISFGATGTCFHGSLPLEICACRSMQVNSFVGV